MIWRRKDDRRFTAEGALRDLVRAGRRGVSAKLTLSSKSSFAVLSEPVTGANAADAGEAEPLADTTGAGAGVGSAAGSGGGGAKPVTAGASSSERARLDAAKDSREVVES